MQARIDWHRSWGSLTSITAYRDNEIDNRQNMAGMDVPPNLLLVDIIAEQGADQISQEFRIASDNDGKVNWLAGLYYLKEDSFRHEEFATFYDFRPFAPFNGNVDFLQNNTTKSTAAYGQVKWDISNTVTLTLGGRYTKDEKTVVQSANDLVNPFVLDD